MTNLSEAAFALYMASQARKRAFLATYSEKASEPRHEAIESFYDWLREAREWRQ